MTLSDEIECAFGMRLKPSRLVDVRNPVTPEQNDALWFSGRDWREIAWQDWDAHSDAFYAFTPTAFVYYLPSILSVTTRNPEKWLGAADALLGILNRSPDVYRWDNFVEKRLIGLGAAEYEAIKAWILSLSGTTVFGDEDALARAYETVDLLQRETDRVRRSIGGDNRKIGK